MKRSYSRTDPTITLQTGGQFGQGQDVLNGPAPSKTLSYRVVRNACASRPVFDAKGFSAKGNESRMPGVPRLHGPGGPNAILGGVWPIVILALQGMLPTGPWSDIGYESGEVAPSRIKSNAPAAIVLVRIAVWILRPVFDALPNEIFGRVGLAMRGFSLPRSVSVETAAGFSPPTLEVTEVHGLDSTTRAAADTAAAGFATRTAFNKLFQNRQSRESFAYARMGYTFVSQDVSLRSGLRLMRALIPKQRRQGSSFYFCHFTTEFGGL